MKTVAWYRIESRMKTAELAGALRSEVLSPESSQGYIVNFADDDKLNAVYVSKYVKNRAFNDIFGNQVVNETVEYLEIEFEINISSGFIEIVSGRAGIRALLANLSTSSNYRIGFGAMHANVLQWSEIFASRSDLELSFDKVLINDLQYRHARGRIEITCDWKVSDVQEYVSSLGAPEAHIERVRLRSLRPNQALHSILFDYSGFCRISATPDTMPKHVLVARQALLEAKV